MLSEKQNVPKKKFKVPHTFVIIIGIVFIASILTWILPAENLPVLKMLRELK